MLNEGPGTLKGSAFFVQSVALLRKDRVLSSGSFYWNVLSAHLEVFGNRPENKEQIEHGKDPGSLYSRDQSTQQGWGSC